MITIEKNVPMPKNEGLPRHTYKWMEDMDVGDSFVFQGTDKELKAFRSVIRMRNYRLKGSMRWEWRWVGDDVMRIWRIA